MAPERAIKAALETIPELKSKVYPLEGLKNAVAPFVFYLQAAEDEVDDLTGLTGLRSAAFEINCVAKNYAALISLSGAVRVALQEMQGRQYADLFVERTTVRQTSPDLKEREVNLYRRMYLLQLDYQLEEQKEEHENVKE